MCERERERGREGGEREREGEIEREGGREREREGGRVPPWASRIVAMILLLLNLSVAQDIEKYLSVHRKGHRKPRLSEPLVATLKQNVQSPIRIIRPSPTPISPSYKAKAQTNVSPLQCT